MLILASLVGEPRICVLSVVLIIQALGVFADMDTGLLSPGLPFCDSHLAVRPGRPVAALLSPSVCDRGLSSLFPSVCCVDLCYHIRYSLRYQRHINERASTARGERLRTHQIR